MFGYIYRTYHAESGFYYIGRHISVIFDPAYKGSGVALKQAWKVLHRAEWNVELLATADTLEELNNLEFKYISDLYRTDKLCLNRRPGGSNSGRHSMDTINRLKLAFAQSRNSRMFKFHNNFSAIGINRLRQLRKGDKNPMSGVTGARNHCSKAVYCVELNTLFGGLSEASRKTGICVQNISKVCKGLRLSAGGYHWKYVDNTSTDKKN